MNITLENATIYIAIVSFVILIVKCLIVSPLNDAIEGLEKAIAKLEIFLSILEGKLDSQNTRITRVEESTRAGHKRLDRIEALFDKEKHESIQYRKEIREKGESDL